MLLPSSRPALLAGALLLPSLASAQTRDLRALQAELALGLASAELQTLDLLPFAPPFAPGGPLVLELTLDGERRVLELRSHSVRSPLFEVVSVGDGGRRALDPGPVRTLRGTVVDDPGSLVAGSLLEDGLHARVRLSSGQTWWIEPAPSSPPGTREHVVYPSSAARSAGTCGVREPVAPDVAPPPGPEPYAAGSLHVAELAADADWEYYDTYGSTVTVQNRIEAIVNMLNVQYERDVLITYVITTILIRTSPNDPYSSSDPDAALGEVRQEWSLNQAAVVRDVAQMYTGKNLQGSVIGIAYPGGICDKGLGYNVCQNLGSLACRADLSAHELGHNWNASHCSCPGYTMNPSLTCANQFRPQGTIPKITAFRDLVDCLDEVPGGTVLLADDFEAGTLDPAWSCSNANRCALEPKAAYDGSAFGLQIKKTATVERAVSTAGFGAVEVLFASRSQNYESSEWLTLSWFDGATWHQAGQWQQKGWKERRIALPAGAGNNAAFAIRFSCDAVGPKERSKVDEVRVVGN